VLATLGYTAQTFALGGMGAWLPKYVSKFREVGDLPTVTTTFGIILVASGLSATLLGGWLGDHLRSRYHGSYFLVSGISMLVGFPLLVAVLYVDFPWSWVLVFLTCFCMFMSTGPINTILANVTHPSLRATGFAINVLVIHAFGDVISPPIMGAINDAFDGDMNPAFLLVSGMILLGGVLWLAGTRYLASDTEKAPMQMDPVMAPPKTM
jgi:MFS family permease